MIDWSGEIVKFLVDNRVSSTVVADAIGKRGAIPNLLPINRGHYQVGKVKWICAYGESNWPVHEQIQDIEGGNIVLVEAFDCKDRAIFGELVSKYILVHRSNKAIVVKGKLRDIGELIQHNWPIWCEGYNPEGCFNRQPANELNNAIKEESMNKYEGAIAVCDDGGVVVVERELINEDLIISIKNVLEQEKIWFERLDKYGENTFDIVCRKTYLK